VAWVTAIATRMPRRILPDGMTALGVLAGLGVCVAYQLDFVLAKLELTVFDVIGLAPAATMIVLLVGRAARNLRQLARKEPAAPRG